MKLLKLILPVLVLFMFNSCTTTEEEIVDVNEKVNFDADYVDNSKEFVIVNELFKDFSKGNKVSLEMISEFWKTNEALATSFSKKAAEETNLSDEINIDNIDMNKAGGDRYERLFYEYNYLNYVNTRDLNIYGNDILHAKKEVDHANAEILIAQVWLLRLGYNNAMFDAFISYINGLSNDIKTVGRQE